MSPQTFAALENLTPFYFRREFIACASQGLAVKKCKGVRKAVFKKNIAHEDYKTCLFSRKKQMIKMNVIRSHKHEIFTETINKVALSGEDDKRKIREDGISTFGHWWLS